MMKIWIYRLVNDSEQGVSIQGEKKSFTVWHDPYEGREAYVTDWDYVDEFVSFDAAMEYINKTYGDIVELEN
jgi:hypothetical protein